ncbi:hypothetical protein JQN72_13690 [Phycicoccus sp. CSK15P-2]|uniref:hypothetical protein n=1 Tax=Phycicoccus sp. CSK15P-2 TaxID=2807627 RepID=UPI00195093ED|nr:hypothetical protein [Phycicoccus sp. CSK15P-2]MBM6405294.1 hypothetical protein [Phycicoccus sp. CSK15P-2]
MPRGPVLGPRPGTVGLDAGSNDTAAVEHLVGLVEQVLGGADGPLLVSTHLVGAPGRGETGRHHAVAVTAGSAVDPVALAASVEDALDAAVAVTPGGPPARTDLESGAAAAVSEHTARSAGRLARFAGQDGVERVVTVGELLESGTVDAVEALPGIEVTRASTLDLREWARPVWRAGRRVLSVQAGAGGVLLPFERRVQVPCCHDH